MKFLVSILIVAASQRVVAIPVDSIDAMQKTPLAPRGGVLMVQLVTELNGDDWPSKLVVTFDDGNTREGVVGWIEKNPNISSWTTNPFTVRPITQEDNTLLIHPKDITTGPVLLVELPEEGNGKITFGGTTLSPQWINLPSALPNLSITINQATTFLLQESRDELPEWNPLEYWRWTIVASKQSKIVPHPPSSSEVARLAALQGSHLWRIGFDRLARSSRGVAAACRDLLSSTAYDGEHQYACWVVNPQALQILLYTMLDMSSSSRQLSTRALSWAEDQQPYMHWLEQVYGEGVTLAIANPTIEPVVASIRWQEKNDIPIAVEIPSSETLRTKIARPPLIDLSLFGPVTPESQLQWMSLNIGTQSSTLPIVTPEVVVLPPSVQFGTLHPLWTLQSVQHGQPTTVNANNNTSVQLRKVFGVWELFVHCNGISDNGTLPNSIKSIDQLRGVEAISILHPDTNSITVITPSTQDLPEGMRIHRTLQEHGWVVRIELPKTWVENDSLQFAIARTHGDSGSVETGPLPCLPWNINPSPIAVDLSQWDRVKRFPDSH
jgi:hypothetical protein